MGRSESEGSNDLQKTECPLDCLPRFQYTNAPPNLTYSGKCIPCVLEENEPHELLVSRLKDCPYRDTCDRTAGMIPLGRVYGQRVTVTLSEVSSSIVVRSEHQFRNDDRFRLTLRKHLHEEITTDWRNGADHTSITTVLSKGVILAIQGDIEKSRRRQQLDLTDGEVSTLLAELNGLIEISAGSPCSISDIESIARTAIKRSELDCRKVIACLRYFLLAPARCVELCNNRTLGRYIGFIDQRVAQPGRATPLAMALLVPPKEIRHTAGWRILQGEYGPLFGAHSFASTVYVMHDSESGGSYCAQASIIMALGMLSDRGARLLGPVDLTLLAKQPLPVASTVDSACQSGRIKATTAVPVCGLTILDMAKLFYSTSDIQNQLCSTQNDVGLKLRDDGENEVYRPEKGLRKPCSHLNVTADVIRFKNTAAQNRLFIRIVEAYIDARCPVILCVDASTLWSRGGGAVGHSVVIVGYRSTGNATVRDAVCDTIHDPTQFLINDPGLQPYFVQDIATTISAALRFDKNPRNDPRVPRINACFLGDSQMRSHAYDCISRIRRDFKMDYYRYVRPQFSQLARNVNYKIELIHTEDIVQLSRRASREEDRAYVGCLRHVVGRLPNTAFWAIMLYSRECEGAAWVADVCYLFAIGKNPNSPIDARLVREKDGSWSSVDW